MVIYLLFLFFILVLRLPVNTKDKLKKHVNVALTTTINELPRTAPLVKKFNDFKKVGLYRNIKKLVLKKNTQERTTKYTSTLTVASSPSVILKLKPQKLVPFFKNDYIF